MLRVFGRQPEFLLGTWHNIVVSVWIQAGTLECLRQLEACSEAAFKVHPKGLGSMAILEPMGRDASEEVRREVVRQTNRMRHLFKGSAQVIEGTGFGAALARGVIAGLNLVTTNMCPRKVFDNVELASPWLIGLLQPHTTQKLSARELVEDIARVRASD
jgi:hypothetical protein